MKTTIMCLLGHVKTNHALGIQKPIVLWIKTGKKAPLLKPQECVKLFSPGNTLVTSAQEIHWYASFDKKRTRT